MATDTKKEAASNDTNSKVTVGETKQTANFRRPPVWGKNKKKLLIFLLFALIIAIGWGLIGGNIHIGKKVYAQAAGHKIYKKDVQDIKGGKKSISDHDAATVLADKYLAQAMAKENNVTVSQNDISEAGCPNQKTSPYGYQNCVNQVYFTKLTENNEGVYKGKLLVANFSRYLPYQSPLLAEQKMLNPNIGNQADIAADKAYAQSFITNLYNQIQAHKITFDQAIEVEHNDPVVGEPAYPAQSHSGPFDGRISQVNLLAANSIRQKVIHIKPGQTTKPFAVPVSASSTDNSMQDSYFLVVEMDQISGGHGTTSFQQELQQAQKKLGYKVNV